MRPSPAAVASACFLVGCLAVVVVDHVAARIVGVPLIFVGILLGVVAIATPEFLAADRDVDAKGLSR